MNRSRLFVLVPGVLLILALVIGLSACGGGGGGGSPPGPPVAAIFPLSIDSSNRFLVDAGGKPFQVRADTAWSLIAELSPAEAELYLEDRRRKGFNAVVVSLLEHKFSTNAPNNIDDVPPFDGNVSPFTTASDYSKPNELYFARADQYIRMAAAKGILVLLTPSYLGYDGLSDGWYQEMVANNTADPNRLRDYGRYLGQRYKNFTNILWVNGGDYNPPDKSLTRKIALGIKDFDTHSLHTAHCRPETSALDYWAGESWLQVNTTYTYVNAQDAAENAYANPMPFFFIEGRYENEEAPEGTELRVRVDAYQSLLAGAMGQAFGNHPIWHFTGPGVYPLPPFPAPQTWQGSLNSPGALSMVSLYNLFAARDWWKLVPDFSHTFLTAGLDGTPATALNAALGAKANNGSFAIVYMPSARNVTVNLSQLAGPRVVARWFDPASGAPYVVPIPGSPFLTSSGSQVFVPPAVNNASTSGSYTDWVLVLESSS